MKIRKVDSRGRITLGKEYAGKIFIIDPQKDGSIILIPEKRVKNGRKK